MFPTLIFTYDLVLISQIPVKGVLSDHHCSGGYAHAATCADHKKTGSWHLAYLTSLSSSCSTTENVEEPTQ